MLLNFLFHVFMTSAAIIAVLVVVAAWVVCLYAIFIESVPLFKDDNPNPVVRFITTKIEEYRNARS